ncbi:MAG: PLP-dependent aminotransferase family protein [Actinomycetales bacterium]|nr:PLP-dependent aminotransferase family protein [Actinomycetales bacterium]
MSGNRMDPWVDSYAQRAQGLSASAIRALFSVASRPEVVSLAGGMPYVSALDSDQFAEIAARVVREQGAVALQYGSGQGDQTLREQILEISGLVGVRSHPDDVVVTAGSQMGLDLVTKIFCDPGDTVIVESPSYLGALGVFRSYQCNVVHVAMDQQGLDPQSLREALTENSRVKFIYTIPSFHNPAGLTQSYERRKEILGIAQEFNVPILEDDPYGLLGFEGEPPKAIRSLDDQSVIYLGSFSKIIASGLRVGWVIAPHGVREKLVLAAEAATLCPSNFSQLVVSRYLAEQPWQQQIKVFQELYRERRDALLQSMQALMPPGVTWTVPQGGFYSWLTLPQQLNATNMLPRAISSLVAYVPGTGFFADGQGAQNLRLSYCYPDPARIAEGVRRLSGVIAAELELIDTFGVNGTSGPSTGSPHTHSPKSDLV